MPRCGHYEGVTILEVPGGEARAHRIATGRELIRSAEPGEDRGCCYAHDVYTRLRDREGGTS